MTITENSSATTGVTLPEVPVLDAPTPRGAVALVLPAVMLAGTVGFLVLGGGGTTSWLMGGLMVVSLIGMMLSGGGRRFRPAADVAADRERYLRRLRRTAVEVQAASAAWGRDAFRRHPATQHLTGTARGGRTGPDLTVRVGVGTVQGVVELDLAADDPDSEPEPYAALARQRFVDARSMSAGMPLTVNLRSGRCLVVTGAAATDVPRNVVLRAIHSTAPGALRVMLCAPDDAPGWEWLAWLPEHHDDTPAAQPLRTADPATVVAWLRDPGHLPEVGPVLLVLTGASQNEHRRCRDAASRNRALLIVATDTPGDHRCSDEVALHCDGPVLGRRTESGFVPWGTADLVGPTAAATTVRSWARGDRPSTTGGAAVPTMGGTGADLPRLLGLTDAADYTPGAVQSAGAAPLRIPVGIDDAGRALHLDLREAALGGVGPHGLLIGATGSGKSELLRTIVLTLAATHRTTELNLVLVDFKGGAAFLGLGELPHVSALITNLAAEAALVDRMQDALVAELRRRQELLRAAGVPSADAYVRERARRRDLPPLPALVVVCDEFTELLVQRPDLADTFVQLGRLGRSLGVHLLLAAQRLEEGRMRGLDAHLSYRIALRSFSAADSRAVIETDLAYRTPGPPGTGYLKTGADAAVRFRSAYVSDPVLPRRAPAVESRFRKVGVTVLATLPRQAVTEEGREPVPPAPDATTLLDLWTRRLRDHGEPAHRIWLPPLTRSVVLSSLPLGDPLRVPIGMVDRPGEQRQDPLWADFTASGGHGAVVGGARSGKSSLLATIVHALARRHSGDEMHCYVVDLGGGTLRSLATLPQVGGVAGANDPRLVRRTVAHLAAVLADREGSPGVAAPQVFLVIDGWAAFRAGFEDLESTVAGLVLRGLAHGVHVLVATGRWADLRPAMKDQLGLRLELRLGEPAESEVDRRLAAAVPDRSPGRGLTTGREHFLAAVPGPVPLDPGRPSESSAAPARAPRIRMLPERLTLAELPGGRGGGTGVPFGLEETTWRPVAWDPDTDPHLLVWGDGGSGRTTLLHTLALGLAGRQPATATRLLVVDHRRTLLGRLPADHLAGHGTTPQATARLIGDAVAVLTGRLPPPGELSPDDLRNHSWWSGPELFVLVDDHDLVTGGSDPLRPLLDLVPHARDIGLHLVVCRRASAGARALYDPLLQRLRDLGAPGLLLSGPADEGPLHGNRRAGPQPPGRGWWVTRDGTGLVQVAVAERVG